jgi:hypothetical protein
MLVFRIHDFIRKYSDLDCRNHYLVAIMIIFLDNIRQMFKRDILPSSFLSYLKITRIACLKTKAQQVLINLFEKRKSLRLCLKRKYYYQTKILANFKLNIP